jgi:hypothetical protein
MSNHTVTSKLPGDDPDDQQDRLEAPNVITAPNAEVDGLTILQWSEVWLKTMIDAPAGAVNSFNDPQGTVAAAINNPNSPMYFITGVHPGDSAARTFNVQHGQDVFVPIVGITDSEGPQIAPSIPGFVPAQGSFADEVQTVLNSFQFSNLAITVDGKPVANPQETKTGLFSAGVVQAGSEAVDFFGAAPGATLSTTGQIGYFAVLDDLSRGTHTITWTVTTTQFGNALAQSHTDIIKVT